MATSQEIVYGLYKELADAKNARHNRKVGDGGYIGDAEIAKAMERGVRAYESNPSKFLNDLYKTGVNEGVDLLSMPLYKQAATTVNSQTNSQSGSATNNPTSGLQAGVNAPGQMSGTDLMRRFAASLMAPIDPNDPYVKAITQQTSSAASRDASNRGIRGSLAVANTEQAVGNALNQTQMQRQQLGLSALGQAEGLNLQQANLAMQAYNAKFASDSQKAAADAARQQAQNQALWGAVGGLGGAALGYAGGGAQGAQTGLQVGSQLGAGLGGGFTSTPTMPSYNYSPQSSYKWGA
jgi:hypothetical protein